MAWNRPWRRARHMIVGVVLLLGGSVLGGCSALITMVERIGNPLAAPGPYFIAPAGQALHDRLTVADLHADTLLSARDLRHSSSGGHVDFPRLRAGRVGIQVFSIVTNMPLCPARQECDSAPNLVALLAALQGWPAATWTSDRERALYEAAKLHRIAADPAVNLMILRSREDLVALLQNPITTRPIGALLAVEGAQIVGDDLEGVDTLAAAGVRMFGLAHYADNAVASSAHGRAHAGLSDFGRRVVQRAQTRGMIIDLAHADPTVIEAVVNDPTLPHIVMSHTGLFETCPHPRNLQRKYFDAIVAKGGLIGIGAWKEALCMRPEDGSGAYVAAMARTIRLAVQMANAIHPGRGHEYVALGSDFDGWVKVGFDASGWSLLTAALLEEPDPLSSLPRLTEPQIASIMGGNVCRLLLRALPGEGPLPDPALCVA